mgnify:CR=1 FL=1
MAKRPDISIILISSKEEYLFDCLETVYMALERIENEVILIDNASEDNLGKKVNKRFPEVKVLRRDENGGFGENNNMGMKIAKGRYVLLLNDDTKVIDKDIFKEMIEWMDGHPKVGVSSCALVNPDKETYQGSGGYFPTLPRVFAWMTFLDDIPGLDLLIKPYHPLSGWSPLYKGEGYFKKIHKQDWVTGAYYLMRKEAMDEVGLFDEDFFLYVEEVDLSYRFAKKGWEIWYLPKWKIVHYGQVTTGSENAMIREFENLKLFYKKHYAKWKVPVLTLLLKMGAVLRMGIFGILKGKSAVNTYAKAFKAV